MMSPAVPTGSLTRLYRNAGADVAMQRCEENRKASMTDCTTAPLVSARAPLHTLLRQSHWLLERRMLLILSQVTLLTIDMQICNSCRPSSGKAPMM